MVQVSGLGRFFSRRPTVSAGGPDADASPEVFALPQTTSWSPAGDSWTPSNQLGWFTSAADSLLADRPEGLAAPAPALPPLAPPAARPIADQLAISAAAIPEGAGKPDYARLSAEQAAPGSALVQIGDNLPKLAKKYLGDESRWVEIYNLNRDQIFTPDVILPGMVLRLPTGPKPATPPAPPPARPEPPMPTRPVEPSDDLEALKKLSPSELAYLGEHDKKKFFAVLKPAAVAAEKKYGVPWQVTLAQVALESGWGTHAIGGYNVFGIKGHGPAGTVNVPTHEYRNGRYVSENDNFAKYHDFGEAIEEHGKLFHNGYYNKAVDGFARDHDPVGFARNINGVYATDPSYAQSLISIMRQYDLV